MQIQYSEEFRLKRGGKDEGGSRQWAVGRSG
jgi:hypothetical protein